MSYTIPTDNFTPRLISVDDQMSLTRASIRAFTRQDFEDQANKEVGMASIITAAAEARKVGVKENTLYDLLLSRHVNMKTQKGSATPSVIAPFSLVPRRTVVNIGWFQVVAGGAASGESHAGARYITVKIGTSPWTNPPDLSSPPAWGDSAPNASGQLSSRSVGVANIAKYFLPGSYIVVEHKSTSTHKAYTANFKVISATHGTYTSGTMTHPQATVVIEPNYTSAAFAALSSDEKLPWQPSGGQVSLLANSVSDYESWGQQYPSLNDLTLVDYWMQTIRTHQSYNKSYLEALKAPMTSEYWKVFRTQQLTETRRRQEEIEQKAFIHTCFYGDRINEKQTVEGYTNLPQVFDPANPSLQLEFKANTLGFRTQLNEFGRFTDMANAPLNMDNMFEACYNLKRNRGDATIRVDAMCGRETASLIQNMMLRYYPKRYNFTPEGMVQVNQKALDHRNMVAFDYNVYFLPDQGVELAVLNLPHFDDRLSGFATDQKSMGRALWMLDWSDVAINVIKTASARRTTNEADELYRYVITPNTTETLLNSKTIEIRMGDCNRHLAYENYSAGTPTLTVASYDIQSA